jgi:hypothetical protein
MDGHVVSGNVSVPGENTPLLLRYLYLTNGGRVGTKFGELLPDTGEADRDTLDLIGKTLGEKEIPAAKDLFKWIGLLVPGWRGQQTYQVTQRDERPGEILIRLDFLEPEAAPGVQ